MLLWISPCAQPSSAAVWWCVLPRLSPPRCEKPISTPHGSQQDSPMFPSRYPRLLSHVCTSPCTSGRGAHGTWLHPRAHHTVGLSGCGCRPCGVHVRATSVDAGPGGRKWTAVLPARAPRCQVLPADAQDAPKAAEVKAVEPLLLCSISCPGLT